MIDEDRKKIHPLASGKTGRITFRHSDGKTHTFTSTENSFTGDRLSYFDNDAPSINDTLEWVKSVFNDIRRKAKVIESIGDF